MIFQTANKLTKAQEIVEFYYVADLGITVTAWVVSDTPPLFSLGKLIDGYDAKYTWDVENGPVLHVERIILKCQLNERCPFVVISLGMPSVANEHIDL